MTGQSSGEGSPRDRWYAAREEMERRHPEMTRVPAEYSGWLVGFLDVDPATSTAEGIRLEDPASGGLADARWEAGRHYIFRQVPEADGAWCRCQPVSNLPWDPPQPEAALVTSPARFGDDTAEPAVPAWAPGTDGAGPHLVSADGTPLRWLLLDGYVYDIRADQDEPPWEKGR